MSGLDLILLVLIAAAVLASLFAIRRQRRRGGCSGCTSGHCDTCPYHRDTQDE